MRHWQPRLKTGTTEESNNPPLTFLRTDPKIQNGKTWECSDLCLKNRKQQWRTLDSFSCSRPSSLALLECHRLENPYIPPAKFASFGIAASDRLLEFVQQQPRMVREALGTASHHPQSFSVLFNICQESTVCIRFEAHMLVASGTSQNSREQVFPSTSPHI